MPTITNRKLIGVTALVLFILGALVGLLSVTDFSFDTPAQGRKEREAALAWRREQNTNTCIEHAVETLLEARAKCENGYTTCIFACTSKNAGADNAACVLECVQSTAKCSSVAEAEMEKAWLACRGGAASEEYRKALDIGPLLPDLNTTDTNLHTAASVHENRFCIGNLDERNVNPERDGNGFICKKALLKPKCETHEELASLYCACCHCYSQCNLRETEFIGCHTHIDCDA